MEIDAKQNITDYFRSKQQKSFISFNHIINFAKFFQPPTRSNFVPTMSTLPIILIINLSAKSDQKQNE